ncbi:MAG: MFS transporter, partial [Methylococcales bacterium]|nr:MFS transporter [Methylococcales bacterium]
MSDIKEWNPEDPQFWESKGKKIANRNLWISIPSLLSGFAVWLYWGIITVQMLNLGFPFEKAELFTLAAIAGLTGATLRIPSSFFIRIAGGRNTIFFTTALLMIPAIGAGFALQDKNTPLWVFQLLAFLSGFGGGNFASSMSNISFFFPKKMQGLALGLNAGLGNAGVTTMQIVIPLVMTFGLFGGNSMELVNTSGTLIGKIPAGSETWIHNAGFVWLILLIPLAFASWFGMNNLRTEHVSPDIGSPIGAFSKILGMLLIGFFTAAIGLYIILPAPTGLGAPAWAKWPVVVGILFTTVMLLKMIPGDIKPNLQRQFKIFGNKHTWVMSIIYTMTFGSFIGFSAGFALAIKVVFGYQHVMVDGVMTHNLANANGPSALMYAWMGP